MLGRRILDIVDGNEAVVSASPISNIHPGTSVGESASGREHEELRKSVREAFSSPYM